MTTAIREIQYALRRLRGSPMFTIAATLTLAIAIGATASVFGVVDGVLLKAFPYREPDRVLTVWESSPTRHEPQSTVATENYFDWATQNHAFASLAAACCGGSLQFTVAGAQETERIVALAVTANYFAALGITPILGRGLASDTSGPAEVVIGYGYWQRRFAGSRSALGQTLTLDNPNDVRPTPQRVYTIVGVMPPGLPGPVEMWTRIYFAPGEETNRSIRYLDVYGRLKPGETLAAATRDLETIAARLAAAAPKTNENWSVVAVPLIDQLMGPVRPALVMLLAAAGCVLLIGAANLANLFLVRCLAKEREMALRTALGATRRRLVMGLVTEAGILGLGATALGVCIAVAGVRVLRLLAPSTLPRLDQVGVDARVVVFAALASLTMVLIFGVLPAWQVSRASLSDALKEGGRGTGSMQHHRLQDGLVIVQVAVALVLLTGAGLLVESFARFRRMDPGFRADGVVAAQMSLPNGRAAERQGVFVTSVLEQLRAHPGVTAASMSLWLPGGDASFTVPFTILGDPAPDPAHVPGATVNVVSADYFRTMGVRLLRGRWLLASDNARTEKVVAVDELLARRFFGSRDPLGRRFAFGVNGRDTAQIVGVVATVKQFGLAAESVPEFYVPFAQRLGRGVSGAYVAVRTSGDLDAEARAIRQVVTGLDPNVPVFNVQTLDERVAQSVSTTRFSTFLASLFAVEALLLGAVGIYSVLAYIVAQQRREIAVRIALGAGVRHVMAGVLTRASTLVGVGTALGSLAAWMLTRALAGLFLGVSPHDPAIFVGAAAVFAVVALAAAAVPAFRTTRVNPVVALTLM